MVTRRLSQAVKKQSFVSGHRFSDAVRSRNQTPLQGLGNRSTDFPTAPVAASGPAIGCRRWSWHRECPH